LGESWSGRLQDNDGCECFVLFEDGAVTVVAVLDGTEGETRGITLYEGSRTIEGTHLTGERVRTALSGPTPIVLPAPAAWWSIRPAESIMADRATRPITDRGVD
jgi:hypothetical protein